MPKIVDDIRYAASVLHEGDPDGTLPKTLLAHSNTAYDLLEACKAAFSAMDVYMSLLPITTRADRKLYEMLREAIAKAEGE